MSTTETADAAGIESFEIIASTANRGVVSEEMEGVEAVVVEFSTASLLLINCWACNNSASSSSSAAALAVRGEQASFADST